MAIWTEFDVTVADGTRLHGRRAGAGDPVLLLHGFSDDGTCWPRVVDALVVDHEVVTYDARYHGYTVEAPDAAWGGADDAIAVVDVLGLDAPTVMGHSMGGVVAAEALAQAPDRFRAGVLEDPAWMSASDQPSFDEARPLIEQMFSTPADVLVEQQRAAFPTWDESEFSPWSESKGRFRGIDRMGDGMTAVLATPWREVVDRFRVPVFLVCGGDAAAGRIITPEMAAEAAQRCPTLEVVTFPEAGHEIRRVVFDGYIAAVREFLART